MCNAIVNYYFIFFKWFLSAVLYLNSKEYACASLFGDNCNECTLYECKTCAEGTPFTVDGKSECTCPVG